MSNLGLGVMINMLGGNEGSVRAIKDSIGKVIQSMELRAGEGRDDEDLLVIKFTDGTGIQLWDSGQSCCERRFMSCNDVMDSYAGATFTGIELADAPTINEDGEPHEIQFLNVNTSLGVCQLANHNQHNGYYGGFYVIARPI